MIAVIISIIIIISTFSNINNSFIYPVDHIDLGYLELYETKKEWHLNCNARWENDRLIVVKVLRCNTRNLYKFVYKFSWMCKAK